MFTRLSLFLTLLGAGVLWNAPGLVAPSSALADTCTLVDSPSANTAPNGDFSSGADVVATFDNARQQEGCNVALSIDTTAFDQATPQMQMFMLFNAERQDRGLGQLQLDPTLLSQIDSNHSQEMIQYGYFAHYSPINHPGNVFARLTVNPVIQNAGLCCWENIAGASTAAQAVYIYMYYDSGSKWGHRHNILGNFNWVGIGVATGGPYGMDFTNDFFQANYTPPASADTQAPSFNAPTIISGSSGGTVTAQVTNVQDTGAASGVMGLTGVLFYAGSVTLDPSSGATNAVSATQNGTSWTATLSLPAGETLHAVALDGSGNFTDCAVGAGVCGTPPPPALTSIALSAGWNSLGIPTAHYTNASGLVTELQSQNSGLTVRLVATYVSGRYSLYVPGFSRDIPLSLGQGVDVLTSAAGSWLPQGTPAGASVGLAIHPGWNLISVPYPSSINASAVCSQITNAGMSCSEVADYRSGSWKIYTSSSGTTDFPINRDQGIMVLAGGSGTWGASG